MIRIFTTSWCPHCTNAKTLLTKRGLTYEEIDIEKIGMDRPALAQITGGSSVPQIVINETPIGGYSDLVTLDGQGKLKELVG